MTLKLYSTLASINWMFIEGFQLHGRVTVSILRKDAPFRLYHLFGWGNEYNNNNNGSFEMNPFLFISNLNIYIYRNSINIGSCLGDTNVINNEYSLLEWLCTFNLHLDHCWPDDFCLIGNKFFSCNRIQFTSKPLIPGLSFFHLFV